MSAPACYRHNAVRHDGPLRMIVPSRQPNTPPYLVQLDAYEGNGLCVCMHFQTRLEPLLKRGITPQAAVDGGFAKVPKWGTVDDSCRCFHIHVARLKFADDVIAAISAEQKHANQRTNDPTTKTAQASRFH